MARVWESGTPMSTRLLNPLFPVFPKALILEFPHEEQGCLQSEKGTTVFLSHMSSAQRVDSEGPWHWPWDYILPQGLFQPSTAGRLNTFTVRMKAESVSVVWLRTSQRASVRSSVLQGKWKRQGDRIREPNPVFSASFCPTSDMLTAAIFRR
jgi:hypothetical protein